MIDPILYQPDVAMRRGRVARRKPVWSLRGLPFRRR